MRTPQQEGGGRKKQRDDDELQQHTYNTRSRQGSVASEGSDDEERMEAEIGVIKRTYSRLLGEQEAKDDDVEEEPEGDIEPDEEPDKEPDQEEAASGGRSPRRQLATGVPKGQCKQEDVENEEPQSKPRRGRARATTNKRAPRRQLATGGVRSAPDPDPTPVVKDEDEPIIWVERPSPREEELLDTFTDAPWRMFRAKKKGQVSHMTFAPGTKARAMVMRQLTKFFNQLSIEKH